MKKSLLSILAGALVVVGCQNYDDQFDNLESQISALASTVAGLSQVQSDLASLAGTVSSLSSTVNGLGSTIDTAVADGLADIQADIDAISSAVDGVASSEEVSALSDAVADSQADLEELLANSSVFTGDVTINSVATLDAFHAMGSTLAIVNGNVDIDVSTDMDIVKVQEVANQFLTITKDLDYTAAASTITEVTFDNLTGVQSLTLEQPGGYVLPKLVSAQKIYLSDKYKSSVEIIDFRSLTNVASFGTDSYTSGAITFDKATEIHLTSLPYYAGSSLSITGKKGGVIDITALDDVDSTGEQSGLDLTLSGPSSVTISKLDGKGGSITLSNVETAVINDFDGDISIGAGVESFTSNNVVALSGAMTDIVTLDIKGVLNPNHTATTADVGPAIALNAKADLETLTLSGTFDSISVTSNTNLITATVSADVTDGAGIDFDGNTDLETLTLTGSKAAKVLVDDNDSLLALTIDTTIRASDATGATKDGTISVTGNEDLESLVISSTDVSTLTVQTNPALTSIDGTKLTTLGAGGTTASPINPTVNIYGNDLSASLATDKENATGCTDCDNLEANDLGSFTTDSKIETLKTYLALVAANAKSTANVYFDTVESTVDKDGSETTAETTGQVAATTILNMDPGVAQVVTGAGAAISAKKAFLVDVSENGTQTLRLTIDSVDVLHNGTAYGTIGVGGLTANQGVALTEIKTDLAVSRATALGATLDVIRGGNATMPAIVFASSVSKTVNGENYTDVQAGNLYLSNGGTVAVDSYITTWDKTTFTLGGLSVTVTSTVSVASGTTAGAEVIREIVRKWNAQYGTSGASSTLSVWADLTTTGLNTIDAPSLKSSAAGSRGFLTQNTMSLKFVPTSSAQASIVTSGAVSQTVLDWTIGSLADTTDNGAISGDLIITVTGLNTDLSGLSFTASDTDNAFELSTSEYVYTNGGAGTATTTTTNIYPEEARNDVVNAEGASEGTITTAGVDATLETRVHWLGS